MCFKGIKSFVILVLVAILGGLLVFGEDLASYIHSSSKSFQTKVKNAVPIDFELQRARDLLEEIIPEMHTNIKLIAQEEVDIAALKIEISDSEEFLDKQKTRISKLRQNCDRHNVTYKYKGHTVSRETLLKDLSHQFDQYKENEAILESKKRLLTSRETSLAAAMQLLEKTRSQKRMLANKIETLESQHRLVKASAVGSEIQFDDSKLAQTEKLIGKIKNRLDVAERILAHESRYIEIAPLDGIDESDLMSEVDAYFLENSDQPHDEQKAAQLNPAENGDSNTL